MAQVQGPVVSPYHRSLYADKLFLVGTGIGIAPALEVTTSVVEGKARDGQSGQPWKARQ